MSSCLGLFIDNNIIKYAKISKDHDNLKVETFGIEFYEKIEEAIKKIVEETDSYKIPISINLSNETYNYFKMFALLNKKDLPKAISTEFEALCDDKGLNPNVFESRYALIDDNEDKENLKVIHISGNKIDINKKVQEFEGYNLSGIYPIGMSVSNLIKAKSKENYLIVNIEDKTTITTIINQKVTNVKNLDIGSEDFLSKINAKENSYSKAYEVCKETTIYTSEGKNSGEESKSLEDIMPILYEIVGQVRKTINESLLKFDKIYITGTAALINNIDLYFEEYLEDTKCEILKPSIVKITPDINIKDYVEVNSAISLALMGLNIGIKGMNFKQINLKEQLTSALKSDVKFKGNNKLSKFFVNDLSEPLDAVERGLLRAAVSILIFFIIYCLFASLINNQMENKSKEAQESINNTNSQIQLAEKDNSSIKEATSKYEEMIQNLQEINDKIANANSTKKAIPNLLTAIMSGIPDDVQIVSIQNTSGKHIEIVAQSTQYDQLGFLRAKIKTDGILTDVTSTAGEKTNDIITVKIEGELP